MVMVGWRDRQREEMYGREMTNVPQLLVGRHPRKPYPFVSKFLSAEHSDPSPLPQAPHHTTRSLSVIHQLNAEADGCRPLTFFKVNDDG
jgi:hypothetical protein